MDEFCFRLNHRECDDAFESLVNLAIAAQFFENEDIYNKRGILTSVTILTIYVEMPQFPIENTCGSR